MSIIVCLTLVISAFAFIPLNVSSADEGDIEASIILGLSWLATQQQSDGRWRYNDGFDFDCVDIGTTGLVLLKFVDRAKELGLDPFETDDEEPDFYEYATNVISGFDFLFSYLIEDADGVHTNCHWDVYDTSIAMMAVATTNTPGRVVVTSGGTSAVEGWTYEAVLQGMMDWIAFAQNDDTDTYDCDVGGWGYPANDDGWSDNSNSGYASLGIGFAAAPSPFGFGLTIPPEVITKLDMYIDNTQDPNGGSWYRVCNIWKMINILKTGNLLYEMALVGDDISEPRVQDAISYIEDHWTDTGKNPDYQWASLGWMDSYQAMFTMMKGFVAFGIDTLDVGMGPFDWFDEVSDVIIANQNPAGYFEWINTDLTEGEQSKVARTAWALLTLEKFIPTQIIDVFFDIKPSSCPNPINRKSKGVLPVAICGTEDFDVTTIDPGTIQLTREDVEVYVSPLRWELEDVATPFEGELCDCHELGGDGFTDLTLKFKIQEVKELLSDADLDLEITLTIIGNLKEEFGGTSIKGQDCVWVIK
jgi:hypothetical protein